MQRKERDRQDLGNDPIIMPGDVLHCDVGITVARLHRHPASCLRPSSGETGAPAGLKQALANANAMQTFAMEEIRPGRTGNEILGAVLGRMKAKSINGTMLRRRPQRPRRRAAHQSLGLPGRRRRPR